MAEIIDHKEMVAIFVHLVKGKFKMYHQEEQDTDGECHRQPGNIDDCIHFVGQ
jgi:hypothetical protein